MAQKTAHALADGCVSAVTVNAWEKKFLANFQTAMVKKNYTPFSKYSQTNWNLINVPSIQSERVHGQLFKNSVILETSRMSRIRKVFLSLSLSFWCTNM